MKYVVFAPFIALLLSLTACAGLPSRIEDVTTGMNQWQIRDEFGTPDMMHTISATEQTWTYIEDSDTCTVQFKGQFVSGKPSCRTHGLWPLDQETHRLEQVDALNAATTAAEAKQAAAKKAAEYNPHPMPPLIPVAGFPTTAKNL